MDDYELFIKDNMKISYTEKYIFGKRDKNTLSHHDNYLKDEYIKKELQIYDKYKDTKDIELKYLLEKYKYFIDNKLYLLLFKSFENSFIYFLEWREELLKKNPSYVKSLDKDYEEYLKTCIERAKEGLKLKITYPKIIIKKFMKSIKDIKRFEFIYKFIKNHYLPYCRNEIGLCALKNGKEFYSYFIKSHIGYLKITPDEIHKLGLDLLKDYKKTKKDTYLSKKEMFDDCKSYAKYLYENIIDKYFYFKPKKPFKIIAINEKDDNEYNNSPLGYYQPLSNGIFINLSYYKEVNKNEIHSLIMHECFHSYHYQFMKYHNLPKYKYYKYFNTALVEGFGFYMETYCEDYDDNNELSILRKLRLVVDTGVNYYGWTYKKAYDFMKSYLPNKSNDINNEIDRYICYPAQAISYMIGKLKIIKLRDDYLKKGGNIKDFHHYLLIQGLASFETIDKYFYSNS